MLRNILIWLCLIPDPHPVELSPERQAQVARLDAMYDDIGRLSYEAWREKWLSDDSRW
jgi:hypothetical protein